MKYPRKYHFDLNYLSHNKFQKKNSVVIHETRMQAYFCCMGVTQSTKGHMQDIRPEEATRATAAAVSVRGGSIVVGWRQFFSNNHEFSPECFFNCFFSWYHMHILTKNVKF